MISSGTDTTREQVKKYYGETVLSTRDLKTKACCVGGTMPKHVRAILPEIEDEITKKFYGCGSPIPFSLVGKTVLDLGCGTGRDAYMVAKMVGADGHVIGVDMTEPQLEIAQRHVQAQMTRFGYRKPNIEFHLGYIEDLAAVGVKDNSVDVIISNCVLNLSTEKYKVFSEIFRVLKPGGELYFSDVFASRRIPESLTNDPVLRGECLGGAMYIEDFRRLLGSLGCADYRIVDSRAFAINDAEVEAKLGMIDFYSITVRAFKLDDLEDTCEDYGQVVTYLGSVAECPHEFVLDDGHVFEAGRPTRVCGNTAAMLSDTRFAAHFSVQGDRSTHFGLFDCKTDSASLSDLTGSSAACC